MDGGDLHCSPQGHDEFLESSQAWMEGICLQFPVSLCVVLRKEALWNTVSQKKSKSGLQSSASEHVASTEFCSSSVFLY